MGYLWLGIFFWSHMWINYSHKSHQLRYCSHNILHSLFIVFHNTLEVIYWWVLCTVLLQISKCCSTLLHKLFCLMMNLKISNVIHHIALRYQYISILKFHLNYVLSLKPEKRNERNSSSVTDDQFRSSSC